jgi:DNA adenine methylase
MGNAIDVLRAMELEVTASAVKKETEENYYPSLDARAKDFHKNPRRAAFGWVGGKSKLADTIIAEFAPHKTYIEVFGGALNVLYRKQRSQIEIVNDFYEELINLHLTIKRRPQSLRAYLNTMLVSRDIFVGIRDGKLKPRNDIERAAFYFYRTVLSFGSLGGTFAMPKTRRKVRNIYGSFKPFHDRLKSVCIENMDFQKLIQNYDSEMSLFYLDPPYVGTENYYQGSRQGGFTLKDHERLRDALICIKGKFVLSYNKCEVVADLYKKFNIKELGVTYGINAGRQLQAKEYLIKNF